MERVRRRVASSPSSRGIRMSIRMTSGASPVARVTGLRAVGGHLRPAGISCHRPGDRRRTWAARTRTRRRAARSAAGKPGRCAPGSRYRSGEAPQAHPSAGCRKRRAGPRRGTGHLPHRPGRRPEAPSSGAAARRRVRRSPRRALPLGGSPGAPAPHQPAVADQWCYDSRPGWVRRVRGIGRRPGDSPKGHANRGAALRAGDLAPAIRRADQLPVHCWLPYTRPTRITPGRGK